MSEMTNKDAIAIVRRLIARPGSYDVASPYAEDLCDRLEATDERIAELENEKAFFAWSTMRGRSNLPTEELEKMVSELESLRARIAELESRKSIEAWGLRAEDGRLLDVALDADEFDDSMGPCGNDFEIVRIKVEVCE